MSLIEINQREHEFVALSRRMRREEYKLVHLCKVNKSEADYRFQQELDAFKNFKDNLDPNVKQLFHGTRCDEDTIAKEGLDERLASQAGNFGKGIYFSDRLGKSVNYSTQSSKPRYRGLTFVLVCSVILGKVKEYQDGYSDYTLVREPMETDRNGKKIYYNSVKGKPMNFTEFVVYDKRQVVIDYIGYFRRITGEEKKRDERNDDKSVSDEASERIIFKDMEEYDRNYDSYSSGWDEDSFDSSRRFSEDNPQAWNGHHDDYGDFYRDLSPNNSRYDYDDFYSLFGRESTRNRDYRDMMEIWPHLSGEERSQMYCHYSSRYNY